MGKENVKLLFKLLLCGIIWFVFSIIIGLLLVKFTDFIFTDIVFLEGILLILIGVFSAIGGNPIGASVQGFGQVNAQFIANESVEVLKKEKAATTDIMKTTISIGFSTISLVLGGIFLLIVAFIL